MIKKIHPLAWGTLGALLFVSCSKDPISESISRTEVSVEIQKATAKIPYANVSDLQVFSLNDNVVDYEFSRKMALIDLKDFKKDLFKNNQNATLSEMPVIIYDADNTPKYYEFIVLEQGKEIGTITCFAKKEVPAFTAYALPFVRDYSQTNATKYSDMYPYSSQQKIPSVSNRALIQEELNVQKEAKEFWEDVKKQDELFRLSSFADAWNEYHTITEFNNDALLRTNFSGDCGPAALAWLYRAYYPYYKGTYYPLHGEQDTTGTLKFGKRLHQDTSFYPENKNPLYIDLAEHCRIGYGPDPLKPATMPDRLPIAVSRTFPNHRMEWSHSIRLGSARRSIQDNNPTILLIRNGIELHYVVGFGTKDRYNTYNFWLFKIRKVHIDSWVYVSDNGATISEHNYLPYYMNTHAILGKDYTTFTLYKK